MGDISEMCSFVMERINTFLDMELDEDTANSMREHLSACETCVDEVSVWQALRTAIKNAHMPQRCSSDLVERVTAKIRATQTTLEIA